METLLDKYIYNEINTILGILNSMIKIFNSYTGTVTEPHKNNLIYIICKNVKDIITRYKIK